MVVNGNGKVNAGSDIGIGTAHMNFALASANHNAALRVFRLRRTQDSALRTPRVHGQVSSIRNPHALSRSRPQPVPVSASLSLQSPSRSGPFLAAFPIPFIVYAQGGSVLSATTETALPGRTETGRCGAAGARRTACVEKRESAPRVQTNNRQTNFGIGL